jgi:hypothetical protein
MPRQARWPIPAGESFFRKHWPAVFRAFHRPEFAVKYRFGRFGLERLFRPGGTVRTVWEPGSRIPAFNLGIILR